MDNLTKEEEYDIWLFCLSLKVMGVCVIIGIVILLIACSLIKLGIIGGI